MRAGYVLHSLECLECGVVGKCCSNVLRCLYAVKTVRTCVCEKQTIQRTCVAHDARSHTYNRERAHIHPCIHVCRYTKYKHACMPGTSFQYTTQQYIPYTNAPHYYKLMRAGYVLHSLECLECGVVGKCCSNVLRCLNVYGVSLKAVRTCVCEKIDTAHVHSSQCALQQRNRVRRHIHPCIRICRHIIHKRAPLLQTHASRLCTALT
jgi:hypothetical protein